jgi:phage gp36-like protein
MTKETKKEISTEEATEVLKAEQKKKVEECSKEVGAVLEKHGCALAAYMIVSERGNVPNIQVVIKQ